MAFCGWVPAGSGGFPAFPGLQRAGNAPWIGTVMHDTMRCLIPVFVGVVLVWARGGAAATEPEPDAAWADERTTSDGLVVSARKVPGTRLYEVRASCVAAVAPEKVFAVAMERDTYGGTAKYVVEYRVMEGDSDRLWYVYERLSFPLISDRDYTLRYEVTKDVSAKLYAIRWSTANDRGPKVKSGVIRVSFTQGTLEIAPEAGGTRTRMVCTGVADPGGWVPSWVANYVNRSTVPDLLRMIRSKSSGAKATQTMPP